VKAPSRRERARRERYVEAMLDRVTELAKEKAAMGAFPPLDAPGAERIFRESVRDVAEALAAGRGEDLGAVLRLILDELQSANRKAFKSILQSRGAAAK